MPELKKKIKFIIDRFSMIYEFWCDYCNYRRWNYNNPKVVTRAAQESKMLRQTHMIEKGMSLSEPRKGFGQQKIAVLFEMMDQYLKMGYPSDGMPFQDAIIVLNAYVDMQKGLGYENAAMVEKLKTYDTYRIDGLTAGIKYDTRANLMSNIVDIQCGSLKVNPLTLKMWKKLLKSRKKLQLHVIAKLVKFICIRIRQQMML